jgi:uncharacterized membrane protein
LGGLGCAPDTICHDAPVVKWANFGQGFVAEACQSCHASAAPDRQEAPADVTFDSHDQLLDWLDLVVERAAADPPTMPPSGGVSDDDRYRLRVWLLCYAGE